MTDRWQRARSLAMRQWTDEQIVGALTPDDATDDAAEEVERFIAAGHASLERAREEGKGLIRDRVWAMAMDGDTLDAQQWQALYALGRTHVGYGETHDVAQLREALRKAKGAQKAGKGLRVA